MKKIYIILALVTLITTMAKAQNTCLDAKRIFLNTPDSIPPVGTISPAGPDLGCLTITERQLWFYLPLCNDASAMHFAIVSTNTFNDTTGVIVYGPFSEKVTNCSDLTANKILSCNQGTGASVGAFYNSPVYKGTYYYFLATFSDGVSSPIAWAFFDLPFIDFNCFECNDQVSLIKENNICIVTVDTAINKCQLVWDEFPNTNLSGYKILRESSLTGVYDSIDVVPVGNLSEYVDTSSSPVQKSYTYSVVGIDSCGQSYGPTKNLTTIHLLSFPGGNNQAQLIWNNVYSATTFIPQYYIHRNSNGSGWQLIDSIGITLPTMTYTDIYAPAGNNQYLVELRKITPCVPMRPTTIPYQSVFSNLANTNVTNVEEFTNNPRIRIYPNPATDKFTIDLNYLNSETIDISISDMNGHTIFNLYNVSEKSVNIEKQNFSPGVYIVQIKGESIYRNKLILQ